MTIYSSPYYLKKINHNPVNNNQYVYLSGCDGDITIYENKWEFDLNFYINHNLYLPPNSFLINYNTPFAQISDITIFVSQTAKFPDFVIDKTTCNLYKAKFVIDTSSSDFFNNKFINYPFNFSTFFKVNEEAINSANLENNPYEIDTFMSEFNSLYLNNFIQYTNFYNGDENQKLKIADQFHIENNNWYITHYSNVEYILNEETIDCANPISSLCSLQIDDFFTVVGYNISFNYSIDNSPIKTLSVTIDDPQYCKNVFNLSYPYATSYDESKKEVINIPGYQNGFYIPVAAIGYYTLTIQILTSRKYAVIKLTKPFNFVNSSIDEYFKCEEYWINNIDNFQQYNI
ncbi:MAG: hypothetical protein IJK72_02790 [Mycoplasma sp.]|nr:hypothetical protein [Mycoplasma sp.]